MNSKICRKILSIKIKFHEILIDILHKPNRMYGTNICMYVQRTHISRIKIQKCILYKYKFYNIKNGNDINILYLVSININKMLFKWVFVRSIVVHSFIWLGFVVGSYHMVALGIKERFFGLVVFFFFNILLGLIVRKHNNNMLPIFLSL